MPDETVILLSGGIESSVLLRFEHREGPVRALFIDYGQRAAQRERGAAERQCRALGLALDRLDMAAAGAAFRARQKQRLHVPIPHRNLVILSLALSYAIQYQARRLGFALNRDDSRAYPSAARPFLNHFAALAHDLGDVELTLPLIDLDKADVIRLGAALGVDFATTYSCLLGRARHCGVCPQCHHRSAAFRSAGVSEPDGFYRHSPGSFPSLPKGEGT